MHVPMHVMHKRTRDANIRPQHNHMVVFCPRYYQSPSLPAALSKTDELLAKGLREVPIERFEENQARVYFHESLVGSQA